MFKKKQLFFENVHSKLYIFEFLRKNWLKFLSYMQNFGVLHLKM